MKKKNSLGQLRDVQFYSWEGSSNILGRFFPGIGKFLGRGRQNIKYTNHLGKG